MNQPRNETRPDSGDPAPTSDDYLERAPGRPGSVFGPVFGLVFLVGATLMAFAAQNSWGPPSEGVVPAAEPPPHAPDMPVTDAFRYEMDSLIALIASEPTDTVALAVLVELALASHQPEVAAEYAGLWTEAAPRSTEAWLQRVMSHSAADRWDEALQANRTLLELDPSSLLTHLNMGAIHGNRREPEEARRWWSAIIEQAPGSREAEAARQALSTLEPPRDQ